MSTDPQQAHSPRARRNLVVLAYIPAYLLLDWAIHTKTLIALGMAPWDPPAALSLALLIRYGAGTAPAVAFAALVGEYLTRGDMVPWHFTFLASLVVTTGYVAAAAVLQRYAHIDPRLGRLRDLTWFSVTSVVAALVVAVGGAAVYGQAESLESLGMADAVLHFWIGDVTGIMVLTPALLIHGDLIGRGFKGWRLTGEMVAQAAVLGLAVWVVFGLRVAEEIRLFYLLFLPLTWIAMRHGIAGATLAVLGIQIGAIAGTLGSGSSIAAVREVQLLLLTLAVTGMFLGIVVTERKRAIGALSEREATLNRTLRFASAGEMASAMAHELNQPLSAISTYLRACTLLLAQPERRQELVDTMNKVVSEATRAAEVVQRLREFFRSGALRLARWAPEALVRGAVEPLGQRLQRHDIALRLHVEPGLPTVLADRLQMEVVLHNLAVNAIESLSASGAPRREIDIFAGLNPEGGVRFSVQDTGNGVAPEMREHLFQPFATSKERGMGMGLVISRSIVQAHGGKMWYEPSPTGGASFNVLLPTDATRKLPS